MSEFDGLFKTVEQKLTGTVEVVAQEKIHEINTAANDRVQEIMELLGTGAKLTVTQATKQKTIQGLKHKELPKLIQAVGQRLPLLVVGMAGTGKTHAAEQASEALGLKFYAMSVGAQTSKSDIIGYMNANGGYVQTLFRQAYEKGGVFLMDEIDAGNANVLIQVNSALANQYCAFPDKMVKRHKDFAFIATANTYGNGANRMYVGRNQLDAATLDRFTILNWPVDETLEKAIVQPYEFGLAWHKCIKAVREYAEKNQVRALVTPRSTVRGTILLDIGFEFREAVEASLLNAMPADKQTVIWELIQKTWKTPEPKPKKLRTAELIASVQTPEATDDDDKFPELIDIKLPF